MDTGRAGAGRAGAGLRTSPTAPSFWFKSDMFVFLFFLALQMETSKKPAFRMHKCDVCSIVFSARQKAKAA